MDLQAATDGIRQAAAKDKEMRFTTIWPHLYNIDRLREACFGLTRMSAAGSMA